MTGPGPGSLHLKAGALARNGLLLDLLPEDAGWDLCSLRVAELAPGGTFSLETGDDEILVLSLAGGCEVAVDGERFVLAGRSGVFAGIPDLVYAPIGSTVTLASKRGGRFALPGARARRRLPARHVAAGDVPSELRGAGACSRQVVGLCLPGGLEADRLIVSETFTPAGNWSSYPPHKHDEEREGETQLEEVYYFEVAAGPSGPGFGYQRVYGTPERPLGLLAEVRSGDAVLVPHGYHGPSMAAPGYDLYYLNVMAGPGAERAWRIAVDPDHAWVTEAWRDEPADARLPLVTAT